MIAEGQDLPGVVAAIPRSRRSSARGRQATMDAAIVFRHGMRASRVMDVPSAPGGARPPTPEDREQVIAWALAFADEVLPKRRIVSATSG